MEQQPAKDVIDLKTVEDKINRGDKLTVEEYDRLSYARAKANVYLVLRWIGLIGVAVFGVLFTVALFQTACASGEALYLIYGDMNSLGPVHNIFVETGWDWGPYYAMTRISLIFGAILVVAVICVLFYFSIVDLIGFVIKKRQEIKASRKASEAAAEAIASVNPSAAGAKKEGGMFKHKGAGRPKGSPNKPKDDKPAEAEKPAEAPKAEEAKPAKRSSSQLDAMMRWPGYSTEIDLMSDAELEAVKKSPATAEAEFAKVKAEGRTARKA